MVWTITYDWLILLREFCLVGMFFNLISFGLILTGLILVKKWIHFSFEGFRRWHWCTEGLFLIYLISFLALTITDLALLIWLYSSDLDDWRKKIERWNLGKSDDFYVYFFYIMFYTAINFGMTLFTLYMLEKMSRATWSNKF